MDHWTGVPLGRLGRGSGVLVLTELFPFVQTRPFIRYWTGDVVEGTATGCEGTSLAFCFLGRTYARCGGRGRAPFEVREKHATQEVLLDEDGSLLVRPVPLLDLLGNEEESLDGRSGRMASIHSDWAGRGSLSGSSRAGLRWYGCGSRSIAGARSTPRCPAAFMPSSTTVALSTASLPNASRRSPRLTETLPNRSTTSWARFSVLLAPGHRVVLILGASRSSSWGRSPPRAGRSRPGGGPHPFALGAAIPDQGVEGPQATWNWRRQYQREK